MNSRTGWGIQLRSKITAFVKEQGQTSRKEIINHCGKEATGQIKRLVDNGELVRVKRGVYEFREITISIPF